jgi:hypothetical protein
MSRAMPVRTTIRAAACALLLGGCATAPPPTAPAYDAVAIVQAIRAAGAASSGELDVQPLRDPQVEDLREQATQLEARRMYRGAADLLDRALQLNGGDPALLQERAELAFLLRDAAQAQQLAQQALELGSTTGPLCRRHRETQLQAALLRANDRVIRRGESEAAAVARVGAAAAEVRNARVQREACTVAAFDRY